MVDTQSFRLAGTTTTIKTIDVDSVDGQNVIYWEDIELVFPGVGHICNGSSVVKLIRDSNRARIVPHCIKHHPSVTLEVVLSTSPAERSPADSLMSSSSFAPADGPANTPAFAGTDTQADGQTDATLAKTVTTNLAANPPSFTASVDRVVQALQVSSAFQQASATAAPLRTVPTAALEASKPKLSTQKIMDLASRMAEEPDGHVRLRELNTDMICMVSLHDVDTEQEVFSDDLEEQQQKKVYYKRTTRIIRTTRITTTTTTRYVLHAHRERIEALLTQSLKPEESPIPRLFAVLPQSPSVWNDKDPFSNKFRLYFLCECGEYIKSVNHKAKLPSHIHFAQHEGYEIDRCPEFFRRYGLYTLTILEMLRDRASAAGATIPAVSDLVLPDSANPASTCLQQLKDNIENGIVIATAWLSLFLGEDDEYATKQVGLLTQWGNNFGSADKDTAMLSWYPTLWSKYLEVKDQHRVWRNQLHIDSAQQTEGITTQANTKDVLEDVDLRELEKFMKDNIEEEAPGNMRRYVTDEGFVKWVCLDHYYELHPEIAVKELQGVLDSAEGSLDEETGAIKVVLRSRELTEQFYSAFVRAKSVVELDIDLDWECTADDIQALEDVLKRSEVSILRLGLRRTHPDTKFLSTFLQYGVIFRIEELPNLKSIHIVLSPELTKALRILNTSSKGK